MAGVEVDSVAGDREADQPIVSSIGWWGWPKPRRRARFNGGGGGGWGALTLVQTRWVRPCLTPCLGSRPGPHAHLITASGRLVECHQSRLGIALTTYAVLGGQLVSHADFVEVAAEVHCGASVAPPNLIAHGFYINFSGNRANPLIQTSY